MVYRKYHCERDVKCEDDSCTALTAYVRINEKWTRIGHYGSECKIFTPLDLKWEAEDRQLKQRMASIKYEISKFRKGDYS